MNRKVINYDKQTDTLTLYFNDNAIESSEQITPGVIVDYDADGHVVGVEILDAFDSWFEKYAVNTNFAYGVQHKAKETWVDRLMTWIFKDRE